MVKIADLKRLLLISPYGNISTKIKKADAVAT
jgi:hypothetical protein